MMLSLVRLGSDEMPRITCVDVCVCERVYMCVGACVCVCMRIR